MDLNDTARVRQPRDGIEYRLATISDITYSTPHTTHIRDLRLRFPTGEHRAYTPAEIVVCARADDHAALVAAFTDACRSLRDACRIAHDYDERLSAEIIHLLMDVYGIVATRLDVTLDPDNLDAPATIEQATS
ncbi:hypothetical protein [Actinoplanes sp. NBRC 103695]|uniref:hypothetical protein n=1 Tax=Actinoplanes sp. NBRC 103695 TaxID=3032202 RepID=UPI0024A252C2|nr:hypothetical protein [Actinoplanes sp. NBRC 103695]GLZ01898.1 hypothetical protein Acsp02_91490 [Actinoplanes sp. NBRC 103695]